MKSEDKNEAAATETHHGRARSRAVDTEEGKLLLGKRVLRHFGARSDVQAGSFSVRQRCL
jgi:hypothetical protein